MTEDMDDTVIVPPRAATPLLAPDLGDTIVPERVARPPQRIDHATGEPIVERSDGAEPEPAASAPAFYSFRLGFGSASVMLDVPCYVGRKPSPPRVSSGTPPRLVRVASAHNEVSSTHLEVRQVGSSVVVTDLRSTNGSTVMIPGSIPRKLRQGESVVVSPGTLVDIGDGNILQILPMQRRTPPAGRQP